MLSRSRRIAPVVAVLFALFTSAHAATPHKPSSTSSSVATDKQKLSYSLGMKLGSELDHLMQSMKDDVDPATVLQAIGMAVAHGRAELTIPDAQAQLQAYSKYQQARQEAVQAKKPAPVRNASAADKHKLSYALGMKLGSDLVGMTQSMKDDLDTAVMMRAINAIASHGSTELTVPEAQAQLQAYGKKVQARQQADQAKQAAAQQVVGQKNLADGTAFLAANAKKPGVKVTASGLQYQVVQAGTGPKPKATDSVKVNYIGSTLDGNVFDSSAKNGGPIVFRVDQVIPGWTEGVQLMPVGSKYVFWIPGNLAYGAKGTPGGPIGPNALLKFEVELVSIGAK
jgi:FKBP-type peptidyl-prolyl cis-trans isomerase FkpA